MNYREEMKALNEKWSWITKDIEDKSVRESTNKVLENSYDFMISDGIISESALENLEEEVLNEAPTVSSATGTVVPKIMFPMIRRFMPNLIANELVSVQPISGRSGVVYFTQYQYTNNKGAISANDEFAGTSDTALQGPGFATWYSSEKIGPFTATIAGEGGDTVTVLGTSLTGVIGTSASGYTVKRYEVYNASTGDAYSLTTGDVTISTATTGEVTLIDAATGPWDAGDNVVFYVVYDQEASSKIPEMEFTIDSETINTTERKLKVRWTKEAEQDMKAHHKIDLESELVKMASMEANYEIDRELIKTISDVVPTVLAKTHDWTNDSASTGNNTSGNYLDRHRALVQKVYLLGSVIAKYNRQGTANWAVVSPKVASIMQMLPDFTRLNITKTTGVYNLGTISGLKIYVDPNRVGTEENEVLLGFKSSITNYGAGIVYSPYANWMSGVVTNPDNFNNIRGFFSRYAITTLPRGEYYYAKLNILNL